MLDSTSELIASALHLEFQDVDWDSKFVEAGGTSIAAFRLVSKCRQLRLSLTLGEIFASPSLTSLADRIAAKRAKSQPEAVNSVPARNEEFRQSRVVETPPLHVQCNGGASEKPAPCLDVVASYQMTEMQLSFMSSSQRDPQTNIITYREDHPRALLPRLYKAWTAAIASEDAFRTRFDIGSQRASVLLPQDTPLDWMEIIAEHERDFEAKIIESGCDLTSSPLPVNRFKIIVLDDVAAVLWQVHHVLVDGFAGALMLDKVRQSFAGHIIPNGPSFAKVAQGLNDLHRQQSHKATEFWAAEKAHFSHAVHDLSIQAPNSCTPRVRRGIIRMDVGVKGLDVACARAGVSPGTIFHAAWGLTVARFSDHDTVCFGSVMSGRTLPLEDIELVVGSTINTLPISMSVASHMLTRDFLPYVSSRIEAISDFAWSSPGDGFNREFFTAINVNQNKGFTDHGALKPLTRPLTYATLDIPLILTVEADDQLTFNFDKTKLDNGAVRLVANVFKQCLRNLCRLDISLGNALNDCVSVASQHDVLLLGNAYSNLSRDNSTPDDLVSLFQAAVEQVSGDVAVERGLDQLTYAELDMRSSHLANHLVPIVQPGDVVCVRADRSIDWIVAIYGVLKARAVYCPVDPTLPAAYQDEIVKTSNAKAFIYHTKNQMRRSTEACVTVCTDEVLASSSARTSHAWQQHESSDSLNSLDSSSRPAYLCFTSGTSGRPKGVLCAHEGIVAFQKQFDVRMRAQPGWRIGQFMSPNFDGSIHEIFSALSYGSTLVLWSDGDPFSHLQTVNATMMTPSVAQALDPSHFPALECVYLGGEPVSQATADKWATQKTLYNLYGPTEGTCGVTYKRLVPHQPVTLGQIVPSARVYVLDRSKKLIPRGMVGEIYIAGIQVALGYIGNAEETANRFLVDSVCPDFHERMYRTGDRGYWNSNGELCILGRNDRQVKLRGFRIDLNDIEARIQAAAPECKNVALVRKDDVLVCFVQPATVDEQTVMSKAAPTIPAYALPRRIVPLQQFPLTPTGKLDYKELLRNVSFSRGSQTQTSLTSFETTLANAWIQVLGLKSSSDLTRESSFLDLGGSSVSQMMLAHKLSAKLGLDIPIRHIMESSTLGMLAQKLSSMKDPMKIKRLKAPLMTTQGASEMEFYWWSQYRKGGSTSTFNVPFACRLKPAVSRGKLEQAWNKVLTQHEILRRRYRVDTSGQLIAFTSDKASTVARVSNMNISKELDWRFDLSRENPIRVLISHDCMVVVMSHIISDLTTLRLLLGEVELFYKGSDTAQKSLLTDARPRLTRTDSGSKDFWKQYLANTPIISSPSFATKDAFEGQSHVKKLPAATCRLLKDLVSSQNVTMHQVLLAAVGTIMTRQTEKLDIVFGSPHFNRTSTEEMSAVGLYVQPIPIRVSGEGDAFVRRGLLDSVQKSSQAALENAIDWMDLLRALGRETDAEMGSLFDIMVSFHDERRHKGFLHSQTEPLCIWTPGAKFKLMIEVTALDDDLFVMRFEYLTSRISTQDVLTIGRMIPIAIECLAEDMSLSHMKKRLLESESESTAETTDVDSSLYCLPLAALKSFA